MSWSLLLLLSLLSLVATDTGVCKKLFLQQPTIIAEIGAVDDNNKQKKSVVFANTANLLIAAMLFISQQQTQQ